MRLVLSVLSGSVLSVAAAAVFALPSVAKAAEISSSGAVLFTSDYLYRGISQTDEGPALQGSLTLSHDAGWYVSAWGSNIQFGDGSMELDISLGRSWSLNDDWALDVGLMQYRYPEGDNSATEFNFFEGYAKLSYQDWQLGLALTDDYFGAGVGKFWYLTAGWQQQLTDQLQLNWHLGYNKFADAAEFQTFLGSEVRDGSGYADWSLTLSTQQVGLDWSLSYAGTSVDSAACTALCDNRWVFSLGKSF